MGGYGLVNPNQTLKLWSHILFLCVIWSCFMPRTSAFSTVPRHVCALDSNGEHNCNEATNSSLQRLERISKPCGEGDNECWCMKAIAYTNDVRRRNGKSKMLKPGPMAQLQNAMRYAMVLASVSSLKHQDLGAATNEIGCNRRIRGENIAYNYESEDIAFSCVEQWEHSPAHLDNMLKDNFDEVVIGFYKAQNGRVYCVQTFSAVGETRSEGVEHAKCKSVSVQETPKQENMNLQDSENTEETLSGEDQPAKPQKHPGFEGTLPEENTDPKSEGDVDDVAQHGQHPEDNDKGKQYQDETDEESGDPIMSEEELLEIQEQHAPQPGNGQNADFDMEPIYSNSENFGAAEGDVGANGEIPNKNHAKVVLDISGSEDHLPLNEFVEAANANHDESVGANDKTEGDESAQREAEEQDADAAVVAVEDHDSSEMNYQASQEQDNKYKKIMDSPIADEMKNENENKKDGEKKKAKVGDRACRCLELGKRCWHSLGEETDKMCTPFLPTKKQPTACKLKCCGHCLTKSKSRRCTNKVVKRLCRKMRKIIEKEL